MVSMSGDRQRSASSSVAQEVVNVGNSSSNNSSGKDSTAAASVSSLTAAASGGGVSATANKDKKVTTSGAGATTATGMTSSTSSITGNNGFMASTTTTTVGHSRRGITTTANPATSGVSSSTGEQSQLHNEESPNHIVYRKVRPTKKKKTWEQLFSFIRLASLPCLMHQRIGLLTGLTIRGQMRQALLWSYNNHIQLMTPPFPHFLSRSQPSSFFLCLFKLIYPRRPIQLITIIIFTVFRIHKKNSLIFKYSKSLFDFIGHRKINFKY